MYDKECPLCQGDKFHGQFFGRYVCPLSEEYKVIRSGVQPDPRVRALLAAVLEEPMPTEQDEIDWNAGRSPRGSVRMDDDTYWLFETNEAAGTNGVARLV